MADMDETTGKLLNDEQTSDVILQVGEQRFFVHRSILSSQSEVFKTMLCDPTWQPNQQAASLGDPARDGEQGQRQQDLVEEELCANVFEDFLKFIYTSSVSITKDNAVPLIRLADKYMVVELRNLCEKFFIDIRHDVDAFVSFLCLSSLAGMARIYETCIQGLKTNFNLLTSEHLSQVDADILIALLDSGFDVVVNDEYTVFKTIESWLEVCEDNEKFLQIIGLIRFPYMKASQLDELATSSAVYKRALTLNQDMHRSILEMKGLYDEGSLGDISQVFPRPRLYLDSGTQCLPDGQTRHGVIVRGGRWMRRIVEDKIFFVVLDSIQDHSRPAQVRAILQEKNIEITITPGGDPQHKQHIALEARYDKIIFCQYFSRVLSPTDEAITHTFHWKPIQYAASPALPNKKEIRLRIVVVEEGEIKEAAHDDREESEEESEEEVEDGEAEEEEERDFLTFECDDYLPDSDQTDSEY